uniref:Uncharacterized protein n=1 Tax=viral metagenome TaxID=1070528 RepID=A0A6C0III3_9ZZZZ
MTDSLTIEINDKRGIQEFRGLSFSNFQKSKVKTELLNSLVNNKIEPACYWAAELVCAGHFLDIWDTIILFFSRYIHVGNPKLPIYIAMRFTNFKDILANGYAGNELTMRNNVKIRQLFSEIICVLCQSRKKHSLEAVKIQKTDEFDMTHMASKLKAPTIEFAKDLFKPDDPKELYIAMNEFAYHISETSKNCVSACYWLEWLLEFETMCKQNKETAVAETRTIAPVLDKFNKDPIWIIWDILLHACEDKPPLLKKILNALLELFSIKYTTGVKKKRRFIIYFAINLLTEHIDFNIPIINNKDSIDAIMKKIGLVYKDVKKNEITLGDDYLFHGLEKTNLDKTIQRLEKMNEIFKQ